MINIDYIDHILATALAPALNRIANLASFDIKTAYQISKIQQRVEKARKEVLKAYYEVTPDFAEKDESGAILHSSDGAMVVGEEKHKAAEAALIKKIGSRTFVVEQELIPLSKIQHIQFSPQEAEGLSVVIDMEA